MSCLPELLKDEFKRIRDDLRELQSSIGPSLASASIPALAEGGLVTQPTLALVGEKGPELIIPLQEIKSTTPAQQVNISSQPKQDEKPSVVVHMKVVTNDAASFRRSKAQIARDLRKITTGV